MGRISKKIILLLCVIISPPLVAAVSTTNIPSNSKQLIVVTVKNPTNIYAAVRLYWRGNAAATWEQVGKAIPATIGANGATKNKKEGDKKTPLGVFKLGSAFGITDPKQVTTKMPYIHIKTDSVCVDDADSKFYNRIVNSNSIAHPDWKSGEQMHRYSVSYKYGVIVDYDTNPAIPGNGSCIFMHVWTGPKSPTSGCVAMASNNMQHLLSWLKPQDSPYVLITFANR